MCCYYYFIFPDISVDSTVPPKVSIIRKTFYILFSELYLKIFSASNALSIKPFYFSFFFVYKEVILDPTGEAEKNLFVSVRFSCGLPHMDTPVFADQQRFTFIRYMQTLDAI